MSLQYMLNQEAFAYIPNVRKLINEAPAWEANQMYCHALKKMSNCSTPLISMNEKQIAAFERDLIGSFKTFEWIK